MADSFIQRFREETGDEYRDLTDFQIASAFHEKYKADTGVDTDLPAFAQEMGVSLETKQLDINSSTKTLKPATIGASDQITGEDTRGTSMLEMQAESTQRWASVLPGMSRGIYEELASEALGIDPKAAPESELSIIRQRIQEAGETPAKALRSVWGRKLSNAPRGLQQTAGSAMAVQGVPPGLSRGSRDAEASLSSEQETDAEQAALAAQGSQVFKGAVEALRSFPDVFASAIEGAKVAAAIQPPELPLGAGGATFQEILTESGGTYPTPEEMLQTDWAQEALQNYQAITKDIQARQPKDFGGKLAFDVVMMAEKMIPAIAAGAITRKPDVGLAIMYAQVYADRAGQLAAEGVNPDDIPHHATASAIIETATEKLPFDILLGRVGWDGIKKIMGFTVAEGLQEGASGLLQGLYDKGTLRPELTMGEILRDAGYETLVGTLGAPLIGGPTVLAQQMIGPSAEEQAFNEMVDSLMQGQTVDPVQAAVDALSPDNAQLKQVLTPKETAPEAPTAAPETASKEEGYQEGEKYHRIVSEVKTISLDGLKQTERGQIIENPEGYDFSIPIEVSIFADGELKISDGHHRVLAAKQLGYKELPVKLQAINAKGENITKLIEDQIEEIEVTGVQPRTPVDTEKAAPKAGPAVTPAETRLTDLSTGEALEKTTAGEPVSLSIEEAEKLIQEDVIIDKQKVNDLAQDIQENGLKEPIELEEKDGKIEIADGHHRIEAMKQLGRTTIPVKIEADYFETGMHPRLQEQIVAKEALEATNFSVGKDEYYAQLNKNLTPKKGGNKYRNNTPITEKEWIDAYKQSKLPVEETEKITLSGNFTTLYRGEFTGNKDGKYYSTDANFAREFTQSGLESEVKKARISNADVYIPENDVYGGDPDAIDAAIKEAKDKGYKAVLLDEGRNQPKSIYVFDNTALKAKAPKKATKPQKPKEQPKKRTQASYAGTIKNTTQNIFAPGDTYVPMMRFGPVPAAERVKLGERTGEVRETEIPSKPIRREHIIKEIERQFGTKIYRGRVKGPKTRLGFFRKHIREIRTRYHNDLEVTAHEFFHWLDDRYPQLNRVYRRNPYKKELLGISYDMKDVTEGFAEFGRLYLTQESEAVLRAPQFYDKFVEMLSAEGILDQVNKVQSMMHTWYNQGALQRFQSKIGQDKEPLKQRMAAAVDGLGDKAIAAVLDSLHGVKIAEAELTGNIADADLSPYKAQRLIAGSRGVTKAVFEHGTIDWDANGDIIFTGPGLRSVFEPVAHAFDEAMQYFAAKRADELMKQGREHHFEPDEIKAALKLGEQYPEIKKVHADYQAFNKRMMDFYQHSGIVSKESRNAMEEMNKDYVPFFRIQEEVTGETTTRRTPFKRLTGGTANVADIFDNISFGVATLIDQSLKNRAKQLVYGMIDQSENSANFAVKIAKDTKAEKIEIRQVQDAFIKSMGLNPASFRSAMKSGVVSGNMSIETFQMIQQQVKMIEDLGDFATFFTFGHAPRGHNIDSVMVKGKTEFYEIADPVFLKAMMAWGPRPVNLALRIAAGFKHTLTRGVTAMPDFQIPNLLRDSFNGFTLSKGGITPLTSSIAGMYDRIIKDNDYWDYMVNGGGYAATIHGETQATRRHLERLYGTHGIEMKTVIDSPVRMLELWDEVTSAAEYGTRLAEYKALRKKGTSRREAAFQGREISTDFAMRGYSDFVRAFTMSVPFMNARMQGLYRLAREVHDTGGKLKPIGEHATQFALRGLLAITLPTLVLYLLNHDDERYIALDDWIKDLHWVIFLPWSDKPYLIPKPFEVGTIFATLPERSMELYIEKDGAQFGEAMSFLLFETFNLNPVPQIIKPFYETELTNEKFSGAPVIPDDLKDVEAFEQYRPWTNESMVRAGNKLNISPIKIEHWIRGYFGTLGMYMLMASEGMISEGRGGKMPAVPFEERPVVRRFMRRQPYRNTSYQTDFYKLAEETRKITATFNKIQSEGRAEDLRQYISEPERKVLFGIASTVESITSQAAALNKQHRAIRLNKNLSAEEKRRQIDDVISDKNELFKKARAKLNRRKLQELEEKMKRVK